VARVADMPIFASDVARQARAGRESARMALDRLVRIELLADGARRSIGADAPDLAQARASAAVERLLEHDFEPHARPEDVPDAELRTLYDASRDSFVHSRLVQVAILSVFTGPAMKAAPRALQAERARQLKAFIDARPSRSADDFGVVRHDPAWADKDLGIAHTWHSEDKPYSREVGRAVQALRQPGDTTELVTDEMGFHIARYMAERPAEDIPFEAVREKLRAGFHGRWRANRFTQLADEMTAHHEVERHPERFAVVTPD